MEEVTYKCFTSDEMREVLEFFERNKNLGKVVEVNKQENSVYTALVRVIVY